MEQKFFIFILAIFTTLFSNGEAYSIIVEGKASYFQPTGSRFDDVYGGSGLYRLEASFQTWEELYAFLSLGYFYKSGESTYTLHKRTEIRMVPITPGLAYYFPFQRIQPYIGIGMPITYVHVKNNYSAVEKRQTKWGVGVQGRAGFLVELTQAVFLDFFGDYTYLKVSFSKPSKQNIRTNKANLSGFSVGAGVGYRF